MYLSVHPSIHPTLYIYICIYIYTMSTSMTLMSSEITVQDAAKSLWHRVTAQLAGDDAILGHLVPCRLDLDSTHSTSAVTGNATRYEHQLKTCRD